MLKPNNSQNKTFAFVGFCQLGHFHNIFFNFKSISMLENWKEKLFKTLQITVDYQQFQNLQNVGKIQIEIASCARKKP